MKQIILALTAWLLGGTSWAQSPIDVHAHIIPPEYREFLQRHGAELEETFPLPVWEAKKTPCPFHRQIFMGKRFPII